MSISHAYYKCNHAWQIKSVCERESRVGESETLGAILLVGLFYTQDDAAAVEDTQ